MSDLGYNMDYHYSARRISATVVDRYRHEMDPRAGTCFIASKEGNQSFIVTNRHVVDPQYQSIKYAEARLASIEVHDYPGCTCPTQPRVLSILEPNVGYPSNRDDVAAIEFDVANTTGYSCEIRGHYHLPMFCPADSFGSDDRSRSILPMDQVAVPGFPMLDGAQLDRPVTLDGYISSDPRFPPNPMPQRQGADDRIPEELQSTRIVLYRGSSRRGASGAPVIAVQRGIDLGPGLVGAAHRPICLVGINGGRIAGSLEYPSDLSYFIRSDAILEAIENLTSHTEA